MVLAGKEYGTGSSRDWAAAKGRCLPGVRAAIAESFERIHRSNLVGMGDAAAASSRPARVAASLGLTGYGADRHRGDRGGGRRLPGRAARSPSGRPEPTAGVIAFKVRACASTRRSRGASTTATAASCTTCSASS